MRLNFLSKKANEKPLVYAIGVHLFFVHIPSEYYPEKHIFLLLYHKLEKSSRAFSLVPHFFHFRKQKQEKYPLTITETVL